MRHLEELYIEEILLNELSLLENLSQTTTASGISASTSNTKQSLVLYRKWKYLAENSHLEQLKPYCSEAEYFFTVNAGNEDTRVEVTTPSKMDATEVKANPESEENLNSSLTTTTVTVTPTPTSATTAEDTSKSEQDKEPTSDISKSINEISSSLLNENASELTGEPLEFLKCIEKLISSTHTVEKHLDNIQKSNREFYEFEKQSLKLNAIKQTLESLALALKTLLLHKHAILDKSNKDTAKKIAKLIANLSKQHQSVVKRFKEKTDVYTKNNDKWNEFHKDYQTINAWLDATLAKVNDLKLKTLENNKLLEIIKVSFVSASFCIALK